MGTKIRLGDLLVRAGLITENDLRVVLAQQKQHGGRLGEHLVRVNLCTDEQIARALARQLGLAFNDLSRIPPSPVISILPEKVASRLQALAVAYEPRTGQLTVAVADPLDDDLLMEVARVTGKSITAQVSSGLALRRAIEHAYVGVEVRDDGTSEFQLVDIHGREKAVHVDEEDLPSLGTGELMPLDSGELQPLQESDLKNADGEEALKMVWSIAELLIERGFFTRADLMKSLRKR
jgi:hypothetical protein